jgi:hypothetical protein
MLHLAGYFAVQSAVKCGAGERWQGYVRPIVGKMKKYFIKSRRKRTSPSNKTKEGWMDWSLLN